MFDNIENLKIISVLKKVSKPGAFVSGRRSGGFNIRLSGTNEYTFEDKQITVGAGDVIFIPKGSRYHYKTTEGSICLTINVDGVPDDAEIFVCSLTDFCDLDFLESQFADLWKFGEGYDKCECKSKFYGLLSYIAKKQEPDYADKRKSEIIEPAVEYLKSNIFRPDLKAEKLHLLCGISNTYFRELFFLRFKTTPKEYITSKRISHAKSIIDSGDFTSVKEYKDPLYFGKVFKKTYGVSPSELNK